MEKAGAKFVSVADMSLCLMYILLNVELMWIIEVRAWDELEMMWMLGV